MGGHCRMQSVLSVGCGCLIDSVVSNSRQILVHMRNEACLCVLSTTSCRYKPTKRTTYTHKVNTAANKQTSFPGKRRRLVWVATEKMHIFTSTSVFP